MQQKFKGFGEVYSTLSNKLNKVLIQYIHVQQITWQHLTTLCMFQTHITQLHYTINVHA